LKGDSLRILGEFKRFLTLSVPSPGEEAVVRRHVGRVVDRNLTIIAGFPICIMILLENPFNGIESIGYISIWVYIGLGFKNPFNGIESRRGAQGYSS